MKRRQHYLLFASIIFIILLLDQILKIWIKTHLHLGEQIALLGDWFYLYFIENEGMAFGISFGQEAGKFILSVLRIVIVGFLIYYVIRMIKKEKFDTILIVIFSLIIAGALGNILDSAFYGLIFSESTRYAPAVLFPPEGGYARFLYGHVVDMFYVKLFLIPEWFPGWGGSYFFPAIFNIADACVTCGLAGLLIFNKKVFQDKEAELLPVTENEKV